MRVLFDRPGAPTVSIILLDWAVRESFHTLTYLNDQDIDRSKFEIIWVEYYDNVPPALEERIKQSRERNAPCVDQWIVLGAPAATQVHKHYCYNVGIALSRGRVCVICDSDAIYPRQFVSRIARCFESDAKLVVHVDQVRNENRTHYPFDYPGLDDVLLDPMCTNWDGRKTRGIARGVDRLHEANYGACMAAKRDALIEIGGADEHTDYLGYICGPYEMTFRLVNAAHREVWLTDLFSIHTWHPSAGGAGNLAGPSDGRGISLRALEARECGRVFPVEENPAIAALRTGRAIERSVLLDILEGTDFTPWIITGRELRTLMAPELARGNVHRHNIIRYRDTYYALPQSEGAFIPRLADAGLYREGLVHGADLDDVVRRIPRQSFLRRVLAAISRRVKRAVGL